MSSLARPIFLGQRSSCDPGPEAAGNPWDIVGATTVPAAPLGAERRGEWGRERAVAAVDLVSAPRRTAVSGIKAVGDYTKL